MPPVSSLPHLRCREARVAAALEIVRLRQGGAPVQQDLEDFVVVVVRRQDERGDVGRVAGRDGVDGLPNGGENENEPFLHAHSDFSRLCHTTSRACRARASSPRVAAAAPLPPRIARRWPGEARPSPRAKQCSQSGPVNAESSLSFVHMSSRSVLHASRKYCASIYSLHHESVEGFVEAFTTRDRKDCKVE